LAVLAREAPIKTAFVSGGDFLAGTSGIGIGFLALSWV
jgi:hypothetical protein